MLLAVSDQGGFVYHRPTACINQNRILLHQRQPLFIDQVMCGLVKHRVQTDHIRLPEYILYTLRQTAKYRLFPVRPQEFRVGADIVLQGLVLVEVVVDQVHLMPFNHHASIGCADAPCADQAHRLVQE